MHELSICLGILSHVERLAREHGSRSVKRIHIEIGPLSGIEPRLLLRAFPLVREGTVAGEAELVATQCPVRVRCTVCEAETEVEPHRLLCGSCGEWRTKVVCGDAMLLTDVELEIEEEVHV